MISGGFSNFKKKNRKEQRKREPTDLQKGWGRSRTHPWEPAALPAPACLQDASWVLT